MVKKRKKRKPKKRTRSGPPSLASSSSAAPPLDDDERVDDDADGGLAARDVLLGAMADTSKSAATADDEPDDEPDAAGDEDDEEEDERDSQPRKLPDAPVQIPLMGAAADDDLEDGEAAAGDDDDGEEYEDDEEDDEEAAAQMGAARYVIFGFFALWLVSGYVAGQALMMLWGYLANREFFASALPTVAAMPHEGQLLSRTSISLVLGAVIAGLVVIYYYVKPDVRQWADEVAEQLGKVKWPTRKEVGNHTVVVLAVSAVLTTILALLDRFWGFVTNLIYSSGL